jgi:hypothetical protein
MRAAQQSRYFQGGDDPNFARNLAKNDARNRDPNGMITGDQVQFPMDKQELKALKDKMYVGARGRVRTGMVFVPRDQQGQPMNPVKNDPFDNRYQCKIENSGPGITNFFDEGTGQESAGFRLFKRRNKKSKAVSCGYSPDIFVNTETASYRPAVNNGTSRTIGNNSLAAELDRRNGGAEVAQRLQRGYEALNRDRSQFYGRSLQPKPRQGQETLRDLEWQLGQGQNGQEPVVGSQAKLAAWQARNGML